MGSLSGSKLKKKSIHLTILIPIKENKIKQNQNKKPKESFEFFSIWNRYFISFKLSSINAFVKEINLSDLIKKTFS